MRGRASFDRSRTYRYSLTRIWHESGPRVAFVMLNPSAADARRDDPTIRRCMGFARAWEFGSLEVVNLFSYRTRVPSELMRADDPVGPGTNRAIRRAVRRADLVVAAWGVHGHRLERDRMFTEPSRRALLLEGRSLVCLGTTRTGAPRHPLYVPAHRTPVSWPPSTP